MTKEIFGALWRPVVVEVVGRTDDDEPKRVCEADAHHVALDKLAQTNTRIEVLADEVHWSIFEDELDLDARMALSEARQDGLDHEMKRCGGHRQAHAAGRLAWFRGDIRERRAHLCEGRARGLHETPSRIGKRHAARRACDEGQTELLLELAHALAHRRARHA